jgi:hypothetical protein
VSGAPSGTFMARLHAREASAARTQPAGRPLKGLCATCESFPTCAWTKPDEGIWHCEEYA